MTVYLSGNRAWIEKSPMYGALADDRVHMD